MDHAERYPWEFVGKAIPLPPDALNPKVTEVEKIVLPTSPVLSSPISNMVTDPSPGKSPPPDGSLSTGKKNSRSGSSATIAGNETTAGDGDGIGSGSAGGITTSNRFDSLSQSTPPPSQPP